MPIYNDKYQKKLEYEIDKCFKSYNNDIDYGIRDYILNNKNFMSDMPRLNIITISNYKAIVNKKNMDKFKFRNDNRLQNLMDLINKSLQWAKKNNYELPLHSVLHLFISDKAPFLKQKNDNFPLFVITKRNGVNFPLFPDNTIECMTLQKKYAGKCYDWDKMKQIIKKYEEKNINKKENIVYFKGVDSTDYNHNIRFNLYKYSKLHNSRIVEHQGGGKTKKKNSVKTHKIKSKKHKPVQFKQKHKKFKDIKLDILLDAKKNYEPMYNFTKYKYLLNLPGRYPWSNRLKYLPLMYSHIIDVVVKTHYENNPVDSYWVTFINILFDDIYRNFNAIDLDYYDANKYVVSKKVLNDNKLKNKKSFQIFMKKLSNKINEIEKDKNGKYTKILKENYNTIMKLNNERIYQYICYAIKKSSKFFDDTYTIPVSPFLN